MLTCLKFSAVAEDSGQEVAVWMGWGAPAPGSVAGTSGITRSHGKEEW